MHAYLTVYRITTFNVTPASIRTHRRNHCEIQLLFVPFRCAQRLFGFIDFESHKNNIYMRKRVDGHCVLFFLVSFKVPKAVRLCVGVVARLHIFHITSRMQCESIGWKNSKWAWFFVWGLNIENFPDNRLFSGGFEFGLLKFQSFDWED